MELDLARVAAGVGLADRNQSAKPLPALLLNRKMGQRVHARVDIQIPDLSADLPAVTSDHSPDPELFRLRHVRSFLCTPFGL
jgi:hypothetical protein